MSIFHIFYRDNLSDRLAYKKASYFLRSVAYHRSLSSHKVVVVFQHHIFKVDFKELQSPVIVEDVEALQDIFDCHPNAIIGNATRLVCEGETRIFRGLINDIPARAPVNLNVDQFEVLKLLSQGGNGKALEVRDRMSGTHLALKVVKKSRDDGLMDELILMEQLAFVRNAGNRHTTQLAASFHDSDNFYLLMDIQTGGDVQQLIKSMKALPIKLARFYAAELLVGIYGPHVRGIMHRDIKPASLPIDEKRHPAISDFGYAKIFEVPEGVHPYGESGPLCQALTGDFLVPEMLLDAGYSFSVDYWSAGITIFQMLVGHTPWHRAKCMEELADCICHAPIPSGAVPRPARTLLFCLLSYLRLYLQSRANNVSYPAPESHCLRLAYFYPTMAGWQWKDYISISKMVVI
ncbi:kinase-like domain-containing protein [Pisolithus thermaeus]|nr:kinase-like domain-containing protein [Pisolithus croceorrhizus]KAI6158851.1 kinase-like domain-containing protein [Pisolithus thermaeus]